MSRVAVLDRHFNKPVNPIEAADHVVQMMQAGLQSPGYFYGLLDTSCLQARDSLEKCLREGLHFVTGVLWTEPDRQQAEEARQLLIQWDPLVTVTAAVFFAAGAGVPYIADPVRTEMELHNLRTLEAEAQALYPDRDSQLDYICSVICARPPTVEEHVEDTVGLTHIVLTQPEMLQAAMGNVARRDSTAFCDYQTVAAGLSALLDL